MANKDDDDLWDTAMRDVQPIARDKSLAKEGEKASRPPVQPVRVRAQKLELPSVAVDQKDKAHAGLGLDRKTAEKLRKGVFPIEARLDLHGMGRVAARSALEDFIGRAQASGKRCVLVITGKGAGADGRRDPLVAGQGVLRREVPGWLSESPLAGLVLKSEAAQPRHGGAGALYVLLRRQRGDAVTK